MSLCRPGLGDHDPAVEILAAACQSGIPCHLPVSERQHRRHISLAKQADLMLIAPATANFIAKAAAGIADDMLTTVLCAFINKPVIVCPAMNTNMYENPITQRNIQTLKDLGFTFVDPKEAMLACGDLGKGALASVDTIIEAANEFLK